MHRLPLAAAALLCLAAPAFADLRFCNQTGSNVSIAIGYKDGETWTSEGWWTAAPGDCTTPVAGDLQKRYYYYRITSPQIDFPTEDYYFCTSPRVFTIVGDTDCGARGYDRHPFNELDTGDAREWTVNVTVDDGAATGGRETTQDDLELAYERLYRAVHGSLQGVWEDTGDSAFRTRIEDHKLTDYYANVVAGTGTWSLADTCDGANDAGPVLLVTYDDLPDDMLCWVIVTLNDDEFVFRAVGATTDVRMRKR